MRRIVPSVDTSTKKKCSKCEQEKPLGDFPKNSKSKDGYRPDCKECRSLVWYKYKENTSIQETQRINHLLRTYGLTVQEYQEMLERQKGCCACCGKEESTNHYGKTLPLAVDHCHKTGAIRGLLCRVCNQVLGHLEESPERVSALLRYIEEKVL
jgi:Autographiviridae endonuclease VII